MEILLLDELAPDAQLWLSDRHQVSYQPMLAHDRAELHRRLYKPRALFVTPEVRVDSALLDFVVAIRNSTRHEGAGKEPRPYF